MLVHDDGNTGVLLETGGAQLGGCSSEGCDLDALRGLVLSTPILPMAWTACASTELSPSILCLQRL